MPQLEVYRIEPERVDERERTAVLEGDEAHHLLRVRRAKPGDRVMLIDGLGSAWPADLLEADKRGATFSLGERYDNWREPPVHIHLGLAVLKGDRWLDALDGCVQAGVAEVTPLLGERSIAGWKENKAYRAEQRALAAAKQCGRGRVPPVHPAQPLGEWCIQLADDVQRIVAEPGGQPLPELSVDERIVAAIGPEGGFNDEELTLLEQHGFTRVDLGARRLRAETAALVTVARLVGSAEQVSS